VGFIACNVVSECAARSVAFTTGYQTGKIGARDTFKGNV
jgi:predicted metalloprotease